MIASRLNFKKEILPSKDSGSRTDKIALITCLEKLHVSGAFLHKDQN